MSHRHGFTLVELSIVLVIIGLLAGGIFAGQALLEAQRLRSLVQEAKTYAMAIQVFSNKYGALPGDMPDAVRIWGRADGGSDLSANCDNPETDVSIGKPTCNGDGNGSITRTGGESFRAWQQLFAADMIGGTFTGVAGDAGLEHAIGGVNSPVGTLDNALFYIANWGEYTDVAGAGMFFGGNYNNTLVLGAQKTDTWPQNPLISGQDAYSIDEKIDEGSPAYGSVRTFAATYSGTNIGNCTSSDTATTAVYVLSSEEPACVLMFLQSWVAKAK